MSVTDRIGEKYSDLSAKLRTAADHVVENPVDVATRSLRAIAKDSGVSPATFSRLARILGYEDYEEMREAGRETVGRKLIPFGDRAHSLHSSTKGMTAADFLARQSASIQNNIAYLQQNVPAARLDSAVDALCKADRVVLVGSNSSSGIVDYFAYQANWIKTKWIVPAQGGMSPAAVFAQLSKGDAVLVITKTPYANRSIRTLKRAHDMGLVTIVITDSHASPALQYATYQFIVPTESPNFFSSYGATVVLLETMISLLVAKVGPEAEQKIRETETQALHLGENWKTET